MTLAARTREAVRANPFLYEALAAGVVNYAAAARFLADRGPLDADADEEAVVAALRRYAEDLEGGAALPDPGARVSMQSGVGVAPAAEVAEPLVVVGETAVSEASGSATALLVTGAVDAEATRHALGRLAAAGIAVEAVAWAGETLVLVVGRRDGPDALRAVEDALGR
ncbi:MAG: hypothetical protein ABEJ31_07095 [Haloarculaceae archaeon]